MSHAAAHGIQKAWWKSAVVYQIYPSSFCDSNNDGIGDLKGIISKVDYLHKLGVNVVWLSPIYKSPQVDMGYDISDYEDIYEPYGTVADVETLIGELHKRGMKLVLDLVVNHTSDQHAWFKDSRSSKTAAKRDWYIWRPPKFDAQGNRKPPNNWRAAFGGSVWDWDETTQEYYLHYYDPAQPDLNYENPELRQTVYQMMRFWLDKGCDGFRMDVIGKISKNLEFPDMPITNHDSEYQDFPSTGSFAPRVHEFIQEMNREVLSHYDILTVGEFAKTNIDEMLLFTHPDRHELQMGFTFEHVRMDCDDYYKMIPRPWTLPQFKQIMSRWQGMRDRGAWHAGYLENHDQPRSVSRWASDAPEFRWSSAKMLAMMHATMFGTLFIHQGEEIGMVNLPKDWPLEEWKDVRTVNFVHDMHKQGMSIPDAVALGSHVARDNGRSPVQWSSAPNGGFSNVKPWMRVNDDYTICNVEAQENDPDSVLTFWRDMLQLRKELEDAMVYGSFEELSPEHKEVYAYVRAGEYVIALNFSAKPVEYTAPRSVKGAKLVKATWNGAKRELEGDVIELQPYSGVIYKL